MNFPPFWAKGERNGFVCWRWSERSLDEALALACQAAQILADRFAAGDLPPKHGGYYPDRPLREPVLSEIKNNSGGRAAVVTRNAYGCLVLNTARVMFVDVDLPEPKSAGGFLKKLFGGPKTPKADDAQGNIVAKAEAWTKAHPGWGWRVYRTRAGLRLLATHDMFDPESAASQDVFQALGADPLYQRLCKVQKCFRARLTPKPWRCGLRRKPERWPWPDGRAEKSFQKWAAQYQSCSFNWATCELVQTIGNREIHPEVQLILGLHDQTTRVESKLALA